MSYNHVKFVKKMCDKYIDKYKEQIPIGIILDIIETTLITVPDSYFSYDMVQEHPEFCKKCGLCCKTLNCKYFNGKTCDNYEARFHNCSEFPYYDIDNYEFRQGLILDPSCNFAIKLAEMVLEKQFESYLE